MTNDDYWGDRYDSWSNDYWYPPVYVDYPVDWVVPMPDYPRYPSRGSQPDWSTSWRYEDVQNVALNLEAVARDIYDQMDAVIDTNPNREYANRLMNVLADLVDASENYTDAVSAGTDWIDSLDQLFYLEAEVKLMRATLDGYSKEYLVKDDSDAMHQYVQQLLWTYKANYIATDIN